MLKRLNSQLLRTALICSGLILAVGLVLASSAVAQAGIPLRYGDSASGSVSAAAPLIIYQFEGVKDDVVRIAVISTERTRDFRPRLALLTASFSQLALSEEGERADLTYGLPQTGLYYLVVTSANRTQGGFTLTLDATTRALTPTTLPPSQPPGPVVPSDDPHAVTASPIDVVAFSETIAMPQGDIADLIEVRFPHLLTAEPQTYRFTLICDGSNAFLLRWADVNTCDMSFEQTLVVVTPGLVPVLPLPVTFVDSELPATVAYTLIIEPVTPYIPRADSAPVRVVDVYSDRVTTFTSTLSRPTGTQAQMVTLRFPDLINSQPQMFRYTLTCDEQYAGLSPALEGVYGDYLAWFDGRRCDTSVTQTIEPANLMPSGGVPVWLVSETQPIFFSYTLTIEPVTPLLAVAAADSNHVVNASVTGVTSFTQAVSAPLGDRTDRVTVRAPALGSGGGLDFTFNLLCVGTGAEAVEWVAAPEEVLGCGDSFAHRLEASSSAPVPGLDMVFSLDNHAEPAHVQYTLLITPADLPSIAPGASDFIVSLTGQSQHSGMLVAGTPGAVANVSVAGLVAGYPRTVVFSLACSGANLADVRVTLQGVLGNYGCGETFQRLFVIPGEQAQFTLTRPETSGSLTYLLTAAPLHSPVAAPDSDPQPLVVGASQPVSLNGAISYPEGDSSDTILLDARQLRSSALPRQYTVRLACEGAASGAVRGLTETGLIFGCGDIFEHTFAEGQPLRAPLSQTSKNDALLPPQPAASTDPLTLPVYVFLPPDAPPGLVSYALFVTPDGASAPSEEVFVAEYITASSTQVTTFTRALTHDQQIHRLSVIFPDLIQAHWQDIDFRLTCSGVGTASVRWLDEVGVPRTCGGTFRQRFEAGTDGAPGITMDVRLDNPGSGPIALDYTLHIEPASPYVPIIPADSTLYQLAIALNQPTTFTRQLSSPEGNRLTRISAAVFEMIGGQAAGRDFTFWLQCDGPNAEITTAAGSFDGFPAAYSPFSLVCNVPVTRFIDEGAGSPPRLYIEVTMPQVPVPAYNSYTLHIVPAGVDLPFDTLPPTATPTPFLLQAITIVPTVTPTPSLTPTPVPPPELIAPSDGAIFDTQPVTLSWTELPGGPRYEIEIQRCDLQTNVCVTELILVNGTSYTLTLGQSAQVIWRVRGILADGSITGFSASRTFLVFLAMPTVTPAAELALIAPSDGAIFDTQPVTLSWTALPGGPRYEVEIQRCDLQTNVCVTELILVNGTSYVLALAQSTQVTWRVRAVLPDGSVTPFTDTREFLVFLPTLTLSPTATPLMLQAITVAPTITPTATTAMLQVIPAGPTATPTPPIQAVPLDPLLIFTATPTPTPTHPSGLPAPVWEWPVSGYTVVDTPRWVTLRWNNVTGIFTYELGMATCTGTPPTNVTCGSYQYTPTSNVSWREGHAVWLDVGLYRFVVRAFTTETGPGPNSEPRLIEVRSPTPTALHQLDVTPLPIPGAPLILSATPVPTTAPAAASPLPVAPVDRDHALMIHAGSGMRFSDAVSHPDGDISDTISITVEGLGREPVNYTLSLSCSGTGTEAVRWTGRGIADVLGCGQTVTVPFGTGANTQTIVIAFDPRAARSFVTYTLNIVPR